MAQRKLICKVCQACGQVIYAYWFYKGNGLCPACIKAANHGL